MNRSRKSICIPAKNAMSAVLSH